MSQRDEDAKKKLVIDIDDTCIDTLTGFIQWLSKLNRLNHNRENVRITSRESLGGWLGITDNLCNLWLKEYEEQSWEWGALYPCSDAQQLLPQIAKSGWDIVGYSRCNSDLNRAYLRRANLELIFPNVFSEFHLINKQASLYPFLINYSNPVCVTALTSTAYDSATAGHVSYMIARPWNADYSSLSVKKFNSWAEMKPFLDKF